MNRISRKNGSFVMEIPCVLMRLKRRGEKKERKCIHSDTNHTEPDLAVLYMSKRLNMGPGLFLLTLTFQLANAQFLHV